MGLPKRWAAIGLRWRKAGTTRGERKRRPADFAVEKNQQRRMGLAVSRGRRAAMDRRRPREVKREPLKTCASMRANMKVLSPAQELDLSRSLAYSLTIACRLARPLGGTIYPCPAALSINFRKLSLALAGPRIARGDWFPAGTDERETRPRQTATVLTNQLPAAAPSRPAGAIARPGPPAAGPGLEPRSPAAAARRPARFARPGIRGAAG